MLRLGLLLNPESTPNWAAEVAKTLSICPDIQFVLKIYDKQTADTTRGLGLFRKIDSILWPVSIDYSANNKFSFLEDVPTLRLSPDQENEFVSISDEALNVVKNHQPDLLLNFGAKPIKIDGMGWLKYGIWSIGVDKTNLSVNPIVGFWEWYYRKSHTTISLLCTTKALDVAKINELSIRTINYSFVRNQNEILSKAIELITVEAIKIANDKVEDSASKSETIPEISKLTRPGLLQVVLSAARLIFRSSKKMVRDLIFDKGWVIFFDISSSYTPSLDFAKFKALAPTRDRFWADPFVVTRNSNHYIFLEEFMWKSKKGHISCLVINSKGNLIDSKIILDKPYHLSYPFIFEDHGALYMIPESTDNKSIDLFECVSFPFQWKFKKTLLSDIQAVDTTVHFQNNYYWLFCGTKQRLSNTIYDELQIFYSDDLLADNWKSHPKNPVVSDIKSARPAGAIFKHEGFLCRPAQIGVPDYGYGLSLNRITELNEHNFSEEVYRTILPDWRKGISSVHTLNFSKGMTVTDGVLNRFRRFQ